MGGRTSVASANSFHLATVNIPPFAHAILTGERSITLEMLASRAILGTYHISGEALGAQLITADEMISFLILTSCSGTFNELRRRLQDHARLARVGVAHGFLFTTAMSIHFRGAISRVTESAGQKILIGKQPHVISCAHQFNARRAAAGAFVKLFVACCTCTLDRLCTLNQWVTVALHC